MIWAVRRGKWHLNRKTFIRVSSAMWSRTCRRFLHYRQAGQCVQWGPRFRNCGHQRFRISSLSITWLPTMVGRARGARGRATNHRLLSFSPPFFLLDGTFAFVVDSAGPGSASFTIAAASCFVLFIIGRIGLWAASRNSATEQSLGCFIVVRITSSAVSSTVALLLCPIRDSTMNRLLTVFIITGSLLSQCKFIVYLQVTTSFQWQTIIEIFINGSWP